MLAEFSKKKFGITLPYMSDVVLQVAASWCKKTHCDANLTLDF